jgi:arginase
MEVELILVPYDSGQRGLRMGAGPEHLVASGLAEELASAGYPVAATTIIEAPADVRAEIDIAFALMTRLAEAVRLARAARRFPLVLAGNCNTAVGTVAGIGGGDRTAVVWFDAHGDFNTPETTVSGCLDGMALGMLTGRCWRELTRRVPDFTPVAESATCLVGARDLDPLEAQALARSAVRNLAAADVRAALAGVLALVRQLSTRAYVHVDLDVLDPSEGSANDLAAPNGVRLDEMVRAIEAAGAALQIEAAALTAYDPRLDTTASVQAAATRIARALLAATTSHTRPST